MEIKASTTQFPIDAAKDAASIQIDKQPSGQVCHVDDQTDWSDGQSASIYCETVLTRPLSLYVMGARISKSVDRIYLPLRLGDTSGNISGLLDTGSAGAVLNAFQVFPESILTKDGFRFPSGSHRIEYNGIIVTDAVVKKMYGGKGDNAKSMVGNLGFAQISFGKDDRIVTGMVPVLFAFAKEKGTSIAALQANDSSSNIIGINPDENALRNLDYDASGQKASPIHATCDDHLTTNCGLISPLRKLTFAPAVDQGFALSRVPMSNCSTSSIGRCPGSGTLTIGLDQESMRGFVTAPMECRGISDEQGTLNLCNPVLRDITISSAGNSFNGRALFDTGSPRFIINVSEGSTMNAYSSSDDSLSVSIDNQVIYHNSLSKIGTQKIIVNLDSKNYSNVGVAFFEEHAFFTNYDRKTIGFR
ncbi:hypothetical protein KR767_06650 [Luteibacter anthropi]|uniref:hypothetical protein n=1 Tax=Luteibacter anthropi TaxID=564369 RepID=UPI002032B1BC|nr:hypothetical protein [Luteibacter anthropi]URX63728.1 hypothetical protein KR767_06650 [Luteibacter anthropi]